MYSKLYKFVKKHIEKQRKLAVIWMSEKYPMCYECERKRCFGTKCDVCEFDSIAIKM